MKVVTLLGGSSAFTPALAGALAARAADLPELELRLYGRNEAHLRTVAHFSSALAHARGADHAYAHTTSLPDALRGADVVVNQVRVGGWEGRTHDERFPLEFDLPGDETIGPGGLASALRATPVVLELARASARHAPGSPFVQMSNPMGILLTALREVDDLATFGLCELPKATLRAALALAGEHGAVDVDYAGLNHQGWFTRVASGDRDLLPAIFDAVEREGPGFLRVEAGAMREWGALPVPYLRLYAHREREVAALRARATSRGEELEALSNLLFERYAKEDGAPPAELSTRDTSWYPDALVPCLAALLGGPPAELYVSEPNRGHLPGLPDEAVVEKRSTVAAAGVEPIPLVAPPPEKLTAFLACAADFEELAARAALRPSEERVVSALRAHPFGIDRATARGLAQACLKTAGAAR